MAGKQHRCHSTIAGAVEFFWEIAGLVEPLRAPCVIPVVLEPAVTVVKKAHVLVAGSGGAADTDLIHHIDIALRFAAGTADLKGGRHTALQYMDQRKPLADVDIFQMSGMSPLARRPAVRQVIRSKVIGFTRVVENIIAGVNAGVK